MVLDHTLWPVIALIGGAIYFDAAGREAAKNLSFRHEGVKSGSEHEQKFFFPTYIIMLALGVIIVLYSLQILLKML